MNDMPIFLRFSGIEYECPEKKKTSQPEKDFSIEIKISLIIP